MRFRPMMKYINKTSSNIPENFTVLEFQVEKAYFNWHCLQFYEDKIQVDAKDSDYWDSRLPGIKS